MKIRESFEKWFSEKFGEKTMNYCVYFDVTSDEHPFGFYSDDGVNALWEGWCAAKLDTLKFCEILNG